MTRIVVMDQELHEALTVVEIPASFIREIPRGGPAYLYLVPPPDPICCADLERDDTCITFEVVKLRLEPVFRGHGDRKELLFWYAYADNATLALKLRAAFLPGQIGEVQRREQEAFWRGVFARAGE